MDNFFNNWGINFLIGLFIGNMTFLPALFNGFIGFLGVTIVSARSSKKRKK